MDPDLSSSQFEKFKNFKINLELLQIFQEPLNTHLPTKMQNFAVSIFFFCSFFVGKPCFTEGQATYHLKFYTNLMAPNSELMAAAIVSEIKGLVRSNNLDIFCAEEVDTNLNDYWDFLTDVDELDEHDLDNPKMIDKKKCEFIFRRNARKTLKEVITIVSGFTKLKMFREGQNSRYHRVAIEMEQNSKNISVDIQMQSSRQIFIHGAMGQRFPMQQSSYKVLAAKADANLGIVSSVSGNFLILKI